MVWTDQLPRDMNGTVIYMYIKNVYLLQSLSDLDLEN